MPHIQFVAKQIQGDCCVASISSLVSVIVTVGIVRSAAFTSSNIHSEGILPLSLGNHSRYPC